jgi:hypothetical protein
MMDVVKMNDLLSLMTPEEIEGDQRRVSVFERWGSIDQTEADERRFARHAAPLTTTV